MVTLGSCPGVPRALGSPCLSMYVGTACYLMFKRWFCWKCQYNKYMFNFIDHLHLYSCEWLWLV